MATETSSKERLRILMLSNLCPPDYDGGFEMRAFQIANSLRDRGHDVQFVTSEYRASFKGQKSDPSWVHRILKYVEKGESGLNRITRFLAALPESVKNAERLRALLEKHHFDIGYLFGLHRIGLATHIPLVEKKIPILWHAGDQFLVKQLKVWPRKAPPYNWLLNTSYRQARSMEMNGDYENIAFVSANLRDYYFENGLVPQNAFIIPRGVDFPIGSDVDRERAKPPLFFQACRLHEQKGPHVAVAAASELSKAHPELNWRLEIAGAPEHPKFRDMLLNMIRANKLEARVALIGQLTRAEVLGKMREATAIIHASIFADPFANTIVEALGCGTPLIGSDIGSIREVVTPDISALLFQPGDARQLSRQMLRVLTDRGLAHALAASGISVVEKSYTMDRILDMTEMAFGKVLAGSPKEKLCASA